MVILKIFSRDFAPIGILYIVLSALVLVVSLARRTRDYEAFSDANVVESSRFSQVLQKDRTEGDAQTLALPPASKRIWSKRPFKTSGRTVALLSGLTIAMEIALFVLVLRL